MLVCKDAPCLQCGRVVAVAGQDHYEAAQQLLAVFVHDGPKQVQAEQDGVEEERQEARPVHILQLHHQLRQQDERKVAPA